MILYEYDNNQTILKELGKRIKDTRISMNITQDEMMQKSGVARKTISRIENGENVNIESILNVLRVLGLIRNLNMLVQEQTIRPTELVDYGKKRMRVKKHTNNNTNWKWGDEE